MEKAKNMGFVLAGMALLALMLISPSSAAPPPAQVEIVSPLTDGMVSVNLGNTPNVKIARDEENPARKPFQANVLVGILNAPSNCESLDVPADHELVIEYVSASAGVPTGQKNNLIQVRTTVGSSQVYHHFAPTFQGTVGSDDSFVTAQPTRLYADPGPGTVEVCFHRNSSTGSALATVSISGYLVAVP